MLEFLLSRPETDSLRLGIVGDDLALLTAARRPSFAAAHISGLLLYRLLEASERNAGYPVQEVQDELRAHPEQRATLADTLALLIHGITCHGCQPERS